MPTTICPTITAVTAEDYQRQITSVSQFAGRVHLDVADGRLAPRKLIDIDKLWWPGNALVDMHIMYQRPFEHLELLIVQHPNLVIVHAEAEGDFPTFADKLHYHGIEVGVALLPQTGVEVIAPALGMIDHVLIFSGNLGYQGGSKADLTLISKVRRLRELKPSLEIGWDGGVNLDNARRLATNDIDVLNVGGFIQRAKDPSLAYRQLVAEVGAA